MPLSLNAMNLGTSLVLLTLFFVEIAIADQEEFQLRREQQMRPHNFDVKH